MAPLPGLLQVFRAKMHDCPHRRTRVAGNRTTPHEPGSGRGRFAAINLP
jgi:hypothetical protein